MKNKNNSPKLDFAVLGGGCFWCLDEMYSRFRGVKNVTAGYAGGRKVNPNYEEVCTGNTGHAEVIKVEYDPKQINYEDLLNVFFSVHNPTTLNRQGSDVGTQYRSIILYDTQEKKELAQKIIRKFNHEEIYPDPIVTELKPLINFYPAEDYHQKYFQKNPQNFYCQAVISPKLAKVRKMFHQYYE